VAEAPTGEEHVDVLPLVLGELDAPGRAAAARHLMACAACRREYDELSSALGEVVVAVPEVQPPLGFDERVLRSLRPVPAPRRVRWARWTALAAAAVLLAVGAATLGWLVSRDGSGPQVASAVSTLQVAGGRDVGTVSVGDVDGDPLMVVALTAAPQGVAYRCRTTFADGSIAVSDAWSASPGSAWIVPLPSSGRAVTKVELVTTADQVWSTADFGS
jgi:predicted anti-sigma-YlaC factor YlaD